jgi:hypothetical protein
MGRVNRSHRVPAMGLASVKTAGAVTDVAVE